MLSFARRSSALCAFALCLFTGFAVSPVSAQEPVPTQSGAANADARATVIANPVWDRSTMLSFRQHLAEAVRAAEGGDNSAAAKSIEAAIATAEYRIDLPTLPHLFDEPTGRIPGAVLEKDALQEGPPFWLLEALVRIGNADTAKRIATNLADEKMRHRAFTLIGVAQTGRYLNRPYVLPPVVEEAPDKWTARSGKDKSSVLEVVSLRGPVVAPRLDCNVFEKIPAADEAGAFVSLGEARNALIPLKEVSLYRELAEVQGKLGDKAGALLTTQTAAEQAMVSWPATKEDKIKRDVARQEIKLLAADLTALGDKPGAKRLEQLLSANAFQQIWLPLLITVNAGALLIAIVMKRSYRG